MTVDYKRNEWDFVTFALIVGVNKSMGKCNQTEKSPIVEKKMLKSLDFLSNPKIITSTMLVKERAWEGLYPPAIEELYLGQCSFTYEVKFSKNHENGSKNRRQIYNTFYNIKYGDHCKITKTKI